jgi:hypothetical protein
MNRRRTTILALAVVIVGGLVYFWGPSLIASQNNEALRVCSDQVAPVVENARVEWRAGFPSGWWCQSPQMTEDTYLFWWS